MSNVIQLLPEHVIDQIKAGEVVDSVAGIIKELIENSIDAGSSSISIHIKNGGLDLISIKDNGNGIAYESLPYAFARHATSKISCLEDLYRNSNYGFRGEALASISSVSKVTCFSTTKNSESQKISIEGSRTLYHERSELSADQSGTEIIVRDLFYNTPVRLKFLNTKTSENNKVKKIIEYYLCSNPDVEFDVRFDDKDKKKFPINSSKKRISALMKWSNEDYFEINQDFEEMQLKAYVGKLDRQRPTQYFFVNARPIEDLKLKNTINYTLNAINESKKKDWFIFLTLPAHRIDINVHPKKTEIKFFKSSLVYSFISNSIKEIYKKVILGPGPKSLNDVVNTSTERPVFTKNIAKEYSFQRTERTSSQQDCSFENHSLVIFQSNPYCFDKKSLISTLEIYLKSELVSIIPLMISQPIESSKNLIFLQKMQEISVEVEQLDNENFLIKSLPQALYNLNYLTFLQEYDANNFDLNFALTFNSFFSAVLNSSFLDFTLEKKVIKRITELDLKNILNNE
jgi:DNA mismatch repair protein MutL